MSNAKPATVAREDVISTESSLRWFRKEDIVYASNVTTSARPIKDQDESREVESKRKEKEL